MFKIKYLQIFSCVAGISLAFASVAADGPAGAPGKRWTPEERQARVAKRAAECQAHPEQCRAERQARFEQRFQRADSNGDGLLSRDEVQKTVPRMAHHFDAIDANGDGQISKSEIMAARKVRHIQRPRRQESQI